MRDASSVQKVGYFGSIVPRIAVFLRHYCLAKGGELACKGCDRQTFWTIPHPLTPMPRGGPSGWGDGLPRFGMASRVGVINTHASVWPLKLG